MNITFENMLTGEKKQLVEGVDYTEQSKSECDFCFEMVNSLDLELMEIPLSHIKLWACDECRKITKGDNR